MMLRSGHAIPTSPKTAHCPRSTRGLFPQAFNISSPTNPSTSPPASAPSKPPLPSPPPQNYPFLSAALLFALTSAFLLSPPSTLRPRRSSHSPSLTRIRATAPPRPLTGSTCGPHTVRAPTTRTPLTGAAPAGAAAPAGTLTTTFRAPAARVAVARAARPAGPRAPSSADGDDAEAEADGPRGTSTTRSSATPASTWARSPPGPEVAAAEAGAPAQQVAARAGGLDAQPAQLRRRQAEQRRPRRDLGRVLRQVAPDRRQERRCVRDEGRRGGDRGARDARVEAAQGEAGGAGGVVEEWAEEHRWGGVCAAVVLWVWVWLAGGVRCCC